MGTRDQKQVVVKKLCGKNHTLPLVPFGRKEPPFPNRFFMGMKNRLIPLASSRA